jgi:hypothetical protein
MGRLIGVFNGDLAEDEPVDQHPYYREALSDGGFRVQGLDTGAVV